MSDFVRLADIADVTVGFVGTMAQHYTVAGVPFLRSLNIKPFKIVTDDLKYVSSQFSQSISKSILHENDVIIVRTGLPGTCCVVPQQYDGCNCSDVVIVHPRTDRVNPHYLAAFINVLGCQQIINNKVGAIQQHFNVHSAEDMLIYVPDIDKQNRIAKVILAINNKIECNERICSELEAVAKTLYDYWFVQFDFPDENGKPYRASGGEMVWNEQLKREIPRGWTVGKIGQLGSIVSGGTPNTTVSDYYCDSGFAWITPNDLSGNEHKMFVGHGERDITQSGIDSSSAVLMPKHSVLLSTRAPIGYLAISDNEVCTNQGFKSIIPDAGYHEYYIYYLLKRNVPAIAQQGVGTTFKEVSKGTLSSFVFLLPPKDIANAFADSITDLCEKRCLLEKENQELEKLRNWLLPMLMNGQARVE